MPGRPPSRSLIGAIARRRPVGTVMPRRLVAADPRRDRDRRLEGVRLAADDVRLADPATIERRDDAGGRVVDVGHLQGDLGQGDVSERAAIGVAQDLADLGVVAGTVDLPGLGDDERAAPAAIAASATSWARNLVSS